MQLFSEEWWNAVVEKLKNDEQFQQKGVDLDGNFHFKILSDSKVNVSEDAEFGLKSPSGEQHWYGPKPVTELDFVFEAKAGNFLDVVTGKKNVVIALTMGSVKLKKGGLGKLTANLGGVQRFLAVIGEVGGL
jgi:putative sterol carrier protein